MNLFPVRIWIVITILLTAIFIMTLHDSYADQIQIPPWVKNTAKWWSEGQIGDSDFLKGIRYLIQQGIMQVPTQQGTFAATGQQIPTWIKNNAGWWANGTIGDEDFVKGIQYLIQVNIINVNSTHSFSLSSSAFEDHGTIPSQYNCDGNDISPSLTITNVPTNAKALALIVDDIDAPRGIFTHWIVWNMSPDTSQLSAGQNINSPQGITSAGKSGYHGPCPPSGPAHRYYFKLYAMDSLLNLNENATKSDLEQSMNDHVLAQAVLIGKYSR
jgi:Raf kinase inhibitor-like YbhB/YbcL family protein